MKLAALRLLFGVCGQLALGNAQSTCGAIKEIYRNSSCCGNPGRVTDFVLTPMPSTSLVTGSNPCAGRKPYDGLTTGDGYFINDPCMGPNGTIVQVLEQSGTNVTVGYSGQINTTGRDPIPGPYWQHGLCPVNVHWHLGTEHLSVGEYDEHGTYPHFSLNATLESANRGRRLAGTRVRKGFHCHKYDSSDTRFTTEYAWKHCVNMHVGETYEVHWPHSAAGACGTPWQYQTPFYDGVFCRDLITLQPLNTFEKIGVQAQVFTIINDDAYFYPDLIRGMIVNGAHGADIAYYTGSTTGTSRSNDVCSKYTPITWQVDRKCHLISASAFDKMCADMKAQSDDMTADLTPAGSRELVADHLAADDMQR